MPTYEYVCKACDEHLEVVQAFTDPPLSTCAACGGELRKVFGNVGIVFKGSGFYKTDSRTGSTGSTGSSAKADTGAKADTPAPKAEPAAATSSGSASTSTSSTAPAAAS